MEKISKHTIIIDILDVYSNNINFNVSPCNTVYSLWPITCNESNLFIRKCMYLTSIIMTDISNACEKQSMTSACD